MDKSRLVEKQGVFGDDIEPIPAVFFTVVVMAISSMATLFMRSIPDLSKLSWVPYSLGVLIALMLFGRFLYARFENRTRNRWLKSRTSGGWIEQDAYGLLQFGHDGYRYIAYLNSFGKVVVKRETLDTWNEMSVRLSNDIFQKHDRRVRIPEETVKELQFPVSYAGSKVRVYLEGQLLYADPGSEEELLMYNSLVKS